MKVIFVVLYGALAASPLMVAVGVLLVSDEVLDLFDED